MDRHGKSYDKREKLRAEKQRVAILKRNYMKKVLPKYEKELASKHDGATESAIAATSRHRERDESDVPHASERDRFSGSKRKRAEGREREEEPSRSHAFKRSRPSYSDDEHHDSAHHDSDSGSDMESSDHSEGMPAAAAGRRRERDGARPTGGNASEPKLKFREMRKKQRKEVLLQQPNRFSAALMKAQELAEEAARKRAERAAVKSEIAGKAKKRAETTERYKERTRKGQPVMKHRITNLLDKLKREAAAKE